MGVCPLSSPGRPSNQKESNTRKKEGQTKTKNKIIQNEIKIIQENAKAKQGDTVTHPTQRRQPTVFRQATKSSMTSPITQPSRPSPPNTTPN